MTEQTNRMTVPQDGRYALVYIMAGDVFILSERGVMSFDGDKFVIHENSTEKSESRKGFYNQKLADSFVGFVQAVNKMTGAGWNPLGAPFIRDDKFCQALQR